MRKSTAQQIVVAYNSWRSAHAGTTAKRVAKVDLDELVDQALREEMVERAHQVAGAPFEYIGPGQEWPRIEENGDRNEH